MRITDIIKGNKIPTNEELKELDKMLAAFNKEYENTPTTPIDDKPVVDSTKKKATPTKPANPMRQAYLKTDHLNNELFEKKYRDIDNEIGNRSLYDRYSPERIELDDKQQKLFEDLLNKYKNSIHYFTLKKDVDINNALAHIKALAKRIAEDGKELLDFYPNITDEFYARTNITLTDFERKLNAIVLTFESANTLITFSGNISSSNEITRAYFVCDAEECAQNKKYKEYKNGFARLSYYDEIIKNERIYYEILNSIKLKKASLKSEYERHKLDKSTPKTLAIIASVLSILSMQPLVGLEVEPYVYFLAILGIFSVVFFLPLGIYKIIERANHSKYIKAQEIFAQQRAHIIKIYLNQIPDSKEDINYVISASIAAHKAISNFEKFLALCIRLCRIPYGYSVPQLLLYKKYFPYVRTVDEEKKKYASNQEKQRIWAEERRKKAEEEKFKKDILDAIERSNTERNTILALAALDMQKTNNKMLKLEEERTEAIKKAIDELK
jgi:hypothetical protein